MKDAPSTRDYDWWLLALVFAICTIGVLEIYSATHASVLAGMHVKQVRWLLIGVILMFVLSRLDYHLILEQAPILYLIGIAALVTVLAVGHTRFGAKRWIPFLGQVFQVSELVKLIIIVVLARFFAEVRTDYLSLTDLLKSKIAVGSGGFWGKGFGNGTQNQLGFVPVRYSDFILAAWAEEQGFKGVLLALGLYMALLLRLIQNAQRAKDRAGMFLVMGVAAALGFHVLVNVAMVIGAMPVTGIPLPLMSYGGSATLFVFMAIGLVMNVRLRRFVN